MYSVHYKLVRIREINEIETDRDCLFDTETFSLTSLIFVVVICAAFLFSCFSKIVYCGNIRLCKNWCDIEQYSIANRWESQI